MEHIGGVIFSFLFHHLPHVLFLLGPPAGGSYMPLLLALVAQFTIRWTALLESFPEERRHQRIHAGHNCWVIPEEEKFLTPEVLSGSSMIGTKDELLERLHDLGNSGLNQVMILPNFDTRYDVIERVAKDTIPNIA